MLRIIMTLAALLGAAAGAAAQTFSVVNTDGARVGVLAGAEAGRLDVDASVESPIVLDGVRFRVGIGHGRWENAWGLPAPAR